MRTSNPALGEETFNVYGSAADNVMTLEGTSLKCLFLTTIVMVVGAWSYQTSMEKIEYLRPEVIETAGRLATLSHLPKETIQLLVAGGLAGFVLGLVTIFAPKAAPYTSPLYAIAEGAFLGSFSTIFEYMYPGAVPVSVGITFGILFTLLTVYSLKIVQPSENFKLGVVAATGGIGLFYLAAIGMSFFGIEMPLLHETGWGGIALSAFVVVVASMNLVLDFDFIEEGARRGAPKYMEWYGAFGLLVTLVWLYLETLKLVAKIMGRSRD